MRLHRKSFHHTTTVVDDTLSPLVRLWILRILIRLNGHKKFIRSDDFYDEDLAMALQLQIDEADEVNEDTSISHLQGQASWKHTMLTKLRQMHKAAEKNDLKTAKQEQEMVRCLQYNVKQLAQHVQLSHTESRILEFLVLLEFDAMLKVVVEYLGGLSSDKSFHALSVVLHIPIHDIKQSLKSQASLITSGLVSIRHDGIHDLADKFALLSEELADHLISSDMQPMRLLKNICVTTPEANLSLHDYTHIKKFYEVALSHLKNAIKHEKKGVNVLLYGQPGTGKTQLARLLAQELGVVSFDITAEDEGEPLSSTRRLQRFCMTQKFLANNKKTLLIFDEVEDIFQLDESWLFSSRGRSGAKTKAWVNQILEENPCPTIWIANHIRHLDEAFVRRFDLVQEIPVPPVRQREKILRNYGVDFLDDSAYKKLAEVETLAPAVVAKAAAVVSDIQSDLQYQSPIEAFENMVSNTLKAQRYNVILHNNATELPAVYDPQFVHTDVDLNELAQGIAQAQSARICLYGLSGTGKTAYARWLAQKMELTLLVKRASDIISCYLGETEKNLARTFTQAQTEKAILLIDEADSFMQDRRKAQRSWEVQHVNEMLTQMEAFNGIFIASTNLMDDIDQAALRRFDIKIQFHPLQYKAACDLLQRYCEHLSIGKPNSQQLAQLKPLIQLTLGDFATVIRQSRFKPIKGVAQFIQALQAECAVKEHVSHTIGFV